MPAPAAFWDSVVEQGYIVHLRATQDCLVEHLLTSAKQLRVDGGPQIANYPDSGRTHAASKPRRETAPGRSNSEIGGTNRGVTLIGRARGCGAS